MNASVGQTMVMGVRAILFGAGADAHLMGLDPNRRRLSGIGATVFRDRRPGAQLPVQRRLYRRIAVTGFNGQGLNPHLSVASGIIACGLVYTLIGVVVMKIGTRWIERLMPPVVTGAVVMAIGLNLAPIAVQRLRLRLRWLDGGADRTLYRTGGGLYPRDDPAAADSRRPDRRLRAVRAAGESPRAG
jgi:hypothetical protein